MMALFATIKWRWNDSPITYKIKLRVTKAVCCQVVYDYGFKCAFATSQLPASKKIKSAIEGNTLLGPNLNRLSSDHLGSQKYIDYIEHIHLKYIREQFRDAQKIEGGKVSYEEIIVTRSQKSSISSETSL